MSARSEEQKAESDRKFLETVQGSTCGELFHLRRTHANASDWKRVAIQRALAKYECAVCGRSFAGNVCPKCKTKRDS